MNDGEQAPEVSLESDRLEQLLEVPAPAQPVVMIEYRNRGVPWWVLVPVLVLPPLIAVLVYRHSVVERIEAQRPRLAYQVQKLAAENAAAPLPPPSEGTAAPKEVAKVAADPAPANVLTVAAPPAVTKPDAAPPSPAKPEAAPASPPKAEGHSAGRSVPENGRPARLPNPSSAIAAAAADDPLKPRVRSLFQPV